MFYLKYLFTHILYFMRQIFQDYVTELELETENKKQKIREKCSLSLYTYKRIPFRCSSSSYIQFLSRSPEETLLKIKTAEKANNWKFDIYLVCLI